MAPPAMQVHYRCNAEHLNAMQVQCSSAMQVQCMATPNYTFRFPGALRSRCEAFAQKHNIPLAEAMTQLLEIGLSHSSQFPKSSLEKRLSAVEAEIELLKSKMQGSRNAPAMQTKPKRNAPAMQAQLKSQEAAMQVDPSSPLSALQMNGKLMHPRDCACLLNLKYPSGWEGLTHRHGTDFERNGYRFIRSNCKKNRAFLWSVSQLEPVGEIEAAIN